jgi:hypothetical protein
MKSFIPAAFFGFYSGWAKDIVDNNNKSKGLRTKYWQEKLLIKRKSIITS